MLTELKIAVLVAAMTSVITPAAFGYGDDEFTRETLRGLDGVHVVIEDFSDDAKRAGFTEKTFQTDVELRLRQNDIKVLKDQPPGGGYVYVQINPLHEEYGQRHAFRIDVAFVQPVYLSRDPAIFSYAATWHVSAVGIGKLPLVREGVKDKVDEFINAYQSVNP